MFTASLYLWISNLKLMAGVIIKYSIDMDTGKSIYIEDAPNGLLCNCICSECGGKMLAVQGEQRKREWHYRHHEDSNCQGGIETALHKYIKQIIVENSEIKIPGERLVYSNARQEERLFSIIPDVSIISNNENIYFEIVVTNAMNPQKDNFYKAGKHKSIEIDVSSISREINPEELRNLILNKDQYKRKIYWSSQNQAESSGNDEGWFWLTIAVIFAALVFWKPSKRKRRY